MTAVRSAVSPMRVERPGTVAEAVAFLAAHPDEGWKPIAGGTDLMVLINNGPSPGARWLDLWRLRRELGGVRPEPGGWVVGGLTTMTELRRAASAWPEFPRALARAASVVGGIQIQNRATVAGNIVNASPAGDTLPVWAVLEAMITLRSVRGERQVPFLDLYRGYRDLDLAPDELLVSIRFPTLEPPLFFHKVGTRAAQAISKVVLAGSVRRAGGRFNGVRLAAGSVAPTPVRLRTVEAALAGATVTPVTVDRALAGLDQDIAPIDDIRSTGSYRILVTRNLLRHYLLNPDWPAGQG